MIDEMVQSPSRTLPMPLVQPALAFAERQLDDRREHHLVRHVEQADRVFGVDVVVVCVMSTFCISGGPRDESGEPAKKLSSPNWLSFEPAVGVVDAAAPAVAHALLELEDRGVVLALAEVAWRIRMSLNCGNGRSSSRR